MVDILVDPVGLVSLILAIAGGFIAVITVVWRVSKNYNEQKSENTQQNQEITALKIKIAEMEKETETRIEKMRIERREEITKAVLNQHERFETVQKQIDGQRAEIKDALSKINIVDTKVNIHEQELVKVNARVDKNLGFITDWNQRIENRIEALRTEIMQLIADTKKEIMGMMNMLINLAGQRRSTR